ncbi:MAG: SMC-Scp complex subunit ScpB [Terriglobia bacterium]|jgi:segregation and condensation protein B
MLNDDILKALIEGIIYVAPEPVTLDGIVKVLEGEERERVKAKLEELVADYEQNAHGIQIRQVANGYKFSTKVEHHEILRKYVKSLKPPVRLSKPALETLAVIAYRQPVTLPEIEEIRGVDSGGVIHTLLEKKLVVTSGRKSVVGRPILYRTSKDFLVHFGLKDVGELPSLKEFEELAKRALGSEWATGEAPEATSGATAAPSAEAGTAAVEGTPETPQQASLPVAERTTPLENAAATEAAPAATEETGAVSAEEPPSCEPVPAGGEPASAAPLPAPTPLAAEVKSEGSQEAAPLAGEPTEASPHSEETAAPPASHEEGKSDS